MQRSKEKGQAKMLKTLHRKLKTDQHEPSKNRGELRCSGRASPKRTSSSSHWKFTFSRHDIDEKLLSWR